MPTAVRLVVAYVAARAATDAAWASPPASVRLAAWSRVSHTWDLPTPHPLSGAVVAEYAPFRGDR